MKPEPPPRKPKRASHTERTDLYPKPTIRKFSWETSK